MNNPHQKYDDAYLLGKYMQSHDNYWLGILLQRYTVLVLGVCMKYLKNEEEAKDGVQQIFISLLNNIDKHHINNFKNWLYTVAKNHCLMQLRGASHFRVDELKEELLQQTRDEGLEQVEAKERLIGYVEDALEDLNEAQKTCITLYYLENRSYAQIAAKTGFSGDQVKSYIQNGKRNLKNLIIKKQQSDG